MNVYSLDSEQLQQYVNSAFVNVVNGLVKEKYLTKTKADEIIGNYSVVMETNRWLPKSVSKWLKLKDDRLTFRLMRAVDREGGEGDTQDE